MKQRIVGVFSIGFEDCQLVLREGTGGEFFNCPGKAKIPRIKIGADTRWGEVVAAVLHEAMEFTLNRLRCRYDCSYDLAQDHAGYVFMATHPQFSDACSRSALFLAECHDKLKKDWRAWNRRPSGKEK